MVQGERDRFQLQVFFWFAQSSGDFGEMLVERSGIGAQLIQFGFEGLKLLFEGIQVHRFRGRGSRQRFQTRLALFQQAGLLLEQLALLLFQLGFFDPVGEQALQGGCDQIIGRAPHQFVAGGLLIVIQEHQPVVAEVDGDLRHVPPEDLAVHLDAEHVLFDPDRTEASEQFRWQGIGRLFEVVARAVAEAQHFP